jgi:hypothetical protein
MIHPPGSVYAISVMSGGYGMVPHPEANVFVTSETEAASGACAAVADGVTGADLSGIRAESVAALHYALLGQDYQADGIDLNVLAPYEEVYAYDAMHGGWLFRFPDDIVMALARLKGAELICLAKDWWKIFENDGRPPSLIEVDRMVRQIVELAQSALKLGRPMYWLAEGC